MFFYRSHIESHSKNSGITNINKELQDQTTNFVLSDAQSFRVVENPYFKHMDMTFINVG